MIENILLNSILSTKINKIYNFDIVYTFVDPSDSKWIHKAKKYNFIPNTKRFDRTHILFSLQTIQKYFTEFDNIYIISDNQKLDLSPVKNIASKIIWIDHKDIIPEKYLPTFNSMVIESFLWKIPNLSNNFIYLNDDFLLGKHINKNIFFDNKSNKPIQFYYKSLIENSDNWHKNIAESNKLFLNKFKSYTPFLYPCHAIYHMDKNYLQKTFNIFEKDIEYMLHNHKFRNYDKSHNLIFLCAMLQDHDELFYNMKPSFKHIYSFTPELIQAIIKNRKTFYCISSSLNSPKQLEYYQKFKTNILT
jgi:hypothetical protein